MKNKRNENARAAGHQGHRANAPAHCDMGCTAMQLRQFCELLARSESRIDRTNEIVAGLSHMADYISGNYLKHIESLTQCRSRLMREIEVLTRLLENERRRNTDLTNRLLAIPQGAAAENHINVSH